MEKTELIHFSRARELEARPIQLPNGLYIKPKELVKWLGFWFDRKLNFKSHVSKRLNLANAALTSLLKLAPREKGLSFRALRQLYKACVLPVADYGTQLWWKDKQTQQLNAYQRLQNTALTKILGAFVKSPFKALEIEAAIPPPKVRFEQLAFSYAIKGLKLRPTHPILKTLRSKVLKEMDELDPAEDTEALPQLFLSKYSSQLSSLASKLKGFINSCYISTPLNLPPWEPALEANFIIPQVSKEEAKRAFIAYIKKLKGNYSIFYTDGSKGAHK
jgi:hypothetical protein